MKKIGVIGLGTMGRGIAQTAATFCYEVILTDTADEAINHAREWPAQNSESSRRKKAHD